MIVNEREQKLDHLALRVTTITEDWQLAELNNKFAAAGIEWLILKGAALGRWLYANPTERQSDDIDILVRYADLQLAAAVVEADGYRRWWINRSDAQWQDVDWHLVYRHAKTGYKMLELHWELEEAGRDRGKTIDEMFADAREIIYNKKSYKGLSLIDAFLHAAFHAFRTSDSEMREQWLRDYELLTAQITIEERWYELFTAAVQWNCCGELARALELVRLRGKIGVSAAAAEFITNYSQQPLADWQERRLKAALSGWSCANTWKKTTGLARMLCPPRERIKLLYPGKPILYSYCLRWKKWLEIALNNPKL
ncbi:MAG: nucleotidyltransferase family protein [Bacillota bacterium]